MHDSQVISAADVSSWHAVLANFDCHDPCNDPYYHQAYAQAKNAAPDEPILWCFAQDNALFAYPFIKRQIDPRIISAAGLDRQYFDLQSVYGYAGPLSTETDQSFIDTAWDAFDEWAISQGVITDFCRFSPHLENASLAHQGMETIFNRQCAITRFDRLETDLLTALNTKTRNMIRKAQSQDFKIKSGHPRVFLEDFRNIYCQTMSKNSASEFFAYDNGYYERLMSIDENKQLMVAVYDGLKMVSACWLLLGPQTGLYHLGASDQDYTAFGVNNLCLYEMSLLAKEQNVKSLIIGGGRTEANDDPLLKFKARNATEVTDFFIGTRVVQHDIYDKLAASHNAKYGRLGNWFLFYRDPSFG